MTAGSVLAGSPSERTRRPGSVLPLSAVYTRRFLPAAAAPRIAARLASRASRRPRSRAVSTMHSSTIALSRGRAVRVQIAKHVWRKNAPQGVDVPWNTSCYRSGSQHPGVQRTEAASVTRSSLSQSRPATGQAQPQKLLAHGFELARGTRCEELQQNAASDRVRRAPAASSSRWVWRATAGAGSMTRTSAPTMSWIAGITNGKCVQASTTVSMCLCQHRDPARHGVSGAFRARPGLLFRSVPRGRGMCRAAA